jgi:hypothetical protein
MTCTAPPQVIKEPTAAPAGILFAQFRWYYPTFGAFMTGEAPNRDRDLHHRDRT